VEKKKKPRGDKIGDKGKAFGELRVGKNAQESNQWAQEKKYSGKREKRKKKKTRCGSDASKKLDPVAPSGREVEQRGEKKKKGETPGPPHDLGGGSNM